MVKFYSQTKNTLFLSNLTQGDWRLKSSRISMQVYNFSYFYRLLSICYVWFSNNLNLRKNNFCL